MSDNEIALEELIWRRREDSLEIATEMASRSKEACVENTSDRGGYLFLKRCHPSVSLNKKPGYSHEYFRTQPMESV